MRPLLVIVTVSPLPAAPPAPPIASFSVSPLLATPPELIAKISNDVQAILRDPAVMAEIERRGSIADPMTPKRFSDFVAAENKKWGEVARIANVKLD